MLTNPKPARRRNSSRANVLISVGFHSLAVAGLFYFAAREGLLGKQLKKIAVEMVREKPPEKPREPEKPVVKAPLPEPARQPDTPQPTQVAQNARPAPAPAAVNSGPPPVAPPAAQIPTFAFDGGREVDSVSDPVLLYKGFVEYSLRSKWNRPSDLDDASFLAEVEISVDRSGRLGNPEWKRTSGNSRWDDSVRQALRITPVLNRLPPTNFPPRILVRFDVQEVQE